MHYQKWYLKVPSIQDLDWYELRYLEMWAEKPVWKTWATKTLILIYLGLLCAKF